MIYDIIGDIHGHADELRLLLDKLGYTEKAGFHAQRGHKAIFVGDFIDRGPKIRETLELVRSMVRSGAAFAVIGNHEFNAICYHTEGGSDGYLRSHVLSDGKNTKQHQATIDQLVNPYPREWKSYLEWFRSLPLFMEFPGLRVVHAAWVPSAIGAVAVATLQDENFLRKAATKGSAESTAVDMLLKGPEIPLPSGFSKEDREGNDRDDMRVAWWKARMAGQRYTYRDLAIPGAGEMPAASVPSADLVACPSYGNAERPVIFGHYWLPDEASAPLVANAACVDYSIAKSGGRLVAYTWCGELKLKPNHFISVPRLS